MIRAPRLVPLAVGTCALMANGARLEQLPTLCTACGQHHGDSIQMRLAVFPEWAEFWNIWLNC